MKKILLLLFFICTFNHASQLIDDEVPIINSNAIKSPLADGDVRLISVYLPEQVDLNDFSKRFPVVYYLHGLGGDNLSFDLDNQILMDDLLAQNEAVPFIIVHVDASLVNGIDEDGLRRYTGTWYINSELNGNFEDFMILDLIPYVDANYPTLAQKEFRALCGQSMGGFGSVYLGMTHPELFCGFGTESGTPFWSVITNIIPDPIVAGSINSPGDLMFTLNSFIIPEIPTSGPNAGKVTPDNTGTFVPSLTFVVFSQAAALSPNVNNSPYYVDLPFEVNANNEPIYTNGIFEIADPITGVRTTITQSLTPRQDIIDIWRSLDSFSMVEEYQDTLKKQAIYIDGGNIEVANAVGARILSDKLSEFEIDHEYILYQGGHADCLTPEPCARNKTIFQMFSAKFAEAGFYSDDIRTKLIGTGTIILENSTLSISNGALVGIETNPDLNILDTNITIKLENNSALLIGSNTNETPQGGLQIGNNVTKATTKTGLPFENNSINATICLNGQNAILKILPYGFLGLGAGINGFAPQDVNQWSVSSLSSVENIIIDIQKGCFAHCLFSTPENHVSLCAIGQSQLYNLCVNTAQAKILGGGSVIAVGDNYLSHPVTKNVVGLNTPGGARNILDTNTTAIDLFFQSLMGSDVFFLNNRNIGFLASSGQLDNQVEQDDTPFEIIESQTDAFWNAIAIDDSDTFSSLESKEVTATLNTNNQVQLTFIDENKNIVCIEQNDIPIGQDQQLNLQQITQEHGYVDVVFRTINGTRKLIRVDNPELL